jgi:phage baseplate assembly protein W
VNKDFLGSGWTYPVKRDEKQPPQILGSSHEQSIAESIVIILSTAPGERIMRPDFGCGIHDLIFAQNNIGTAGLAHFYVEEALVRWEPRIDLEEIQVNADPSDPGLLLITIRYRVRKTDSEFNMVYPFYLTRGG